MLDRTIHPRPQDGAFWLTFVKDTYGDNGNVSVPPPVILKIMLLLILYNVRSERELMKTIPVRLDWLWFLGYDLDSDIPDHSVLSKARFRWGEKAFMTFFERIVWQCVEAGLVDGTKLFVDSSLIQANASNNSIVNKEDVKPYITRGYRVLETRLEEKEGSSSDDRDDNDHTTGTVNRTHRSTTDPDASVVRHGKGKPRLQYKVHRGVDEKSEIITATEVTPGAVSEAHRLTSLIKGHTRNTEVIVETVVADTIYGTTENYLTCHDHRINAHIPDLKKRQEATGRRKGIFSDESFDYNPETDTYRCPAGQTMKRRKHKKSRKAFEYAASPKTCACCSLRKQCTKSKTGRTIKRHIRQKEINFMRKNAGSVSSKRDIRTRQHLIERSFAQATRYGFKHARWRRLWRVQIQEYMTAAIQNMMILLRHVKERSPALGMVASTRNRTCLYFQDLPCLFTKIMRNTIQLFRVAQPIETTM
jgi:transposase